MKEKEKTLLTSDITPVNPGVPTCISAPHLGFGPHTPRPLGVFLRVAYVGLGRRPLCPDRDHVVTLSVPTLFDVGANPRGVIHWNRCMAVCQVITPFALRTLSIYDT